MKRMHKTILVFVMAAVILAATVGGTIAYLTTQTAPMVNTFEPTSVTTEVQEGFDGTTKSNVNIKNTGSTDAYIRATVVANWYDADGNIVAPWTDNISYNTTDWTKGSDGYYYHKQPVAANGNTANLFVSYSAGTAPVAGAHLEMTIICQGVQAKGVAADGTPAVTDAWGAVVAADGTISK